MTSRSGSPSVSARRRLQRQDSVRRVDADGSARRRAGFWDPPNAEEEYLCDLGAAALLMPSDLVAGRYSLDKGLDSVERLARDAKVSL